MKRIALSFILLTLIPNISFAQSDSQIKKQIIAESIASYSGNCPCPYNRARNGSKCGKRSAYNRAGGYSPICYDQDITQDMIVNYMNRNQKH